jgi:oxygen-independent coproporphyrinogen-3 oxidase
VSVAVPTELLSKYDRPGPRYTSYPTVPVWTPEVGDAEYRRALGDLARLPEDELSLYLHLPFCLARCHYCGCNSIVSRDPEIIDGYLDHVERELGLVTSFLGRKRRVVQLHWGGGSPNYLDESQLRRAFGMIRSAFEIEPEGEISIEIDPRIATREQIFLLRELGFNRISLGIQDFDRRVQKAIGRTQHEHPTRELYSACRDAGFESVNLDLIYGLPAQTPESFERTLSTILELRPDRVACYSYAHVPWVRPNQKKVDTTFLPAPNDKFRLFQLAVERFQAAGYEWIGLDHFARSDDELAVALQRRSLHRSFMGYTTRPAEHLLAFGVSGIGDLANRFVQNDSSLDGWQQALESDRLPVVRGHRLSPDDLLRRESILNLMCNLELPFDLTSARFGVRLHEALREELERLRPYEKDGLVRFETDRVAVTETGRFFLRNLCMELDAYLDPTGGKPVFSRTV